MTKMYVDQNQTVTGLNIFSGNTQYFYNGIGFEATGNIYIIAVGNDMVFRDISLGTTKTLSELAAAGWPPTVNADLDMNSYSILNVKKILFITASSARLRIPVGSNMYG